MRELTEFIVSSVVLCLSVIILFNSDQFNLIYIITLFLKRAIPFFFEFTKNQEKFVQKNY